MSSLISLQPVTIVSDPSLSLKEDTRTDIACDVDGVVVPLMPELLRRYNQDWADTLTPDALVSWEVHRFVKPQCGDKVYEYFAAPDLYEQLEPIEGALAGVNRLRALGHDVTFVTSCYYGMVDQKARWLERHGFCMPPKWAGMLPDDLIVATHKQHLGSDLLIDDAPHTIKTWVAKRRRAILVEAPYNTKLDLPSIQWGWCHRARSWEEIVRHVERL